MGTQPLPGSDVLLRLRVQPGELPQNVCLRRLLKRMLRAYGMECVRIQEVPRGSKWWLRRRHTPDAMDRP